MKWEFYRPDRDDEADVQSMNIDIQGAYDAAAEFIVEARFSAWDHPLETELRLRPAAGEWKTFTVQAEARPVFFARELRS